VDRACFWYRSGKYKARLRIVNVIYFVNDKTVYISNLFLIAESIACPAGYIKCPRSFCIPPRLICDGEKHCKDGVDEMDCGEFTSQLLKIKEQFF
jgi:hypothetical protein